MASTTGGIKAYIPRLWGFTARVILHFLENRGILMAGGVAYNTLLSIVPFFVVILIGLSHFYDPEQLFAIISAQLNFILPDQSGELAETVHMALEARSVLGGVGIVMLLFFSSLAFRMLEEAIAAIFKVPGKKAEIRRVWVSALIPFAYILVFALGIILLTIVNSILESLSGNCIAIGEWRCGLTEAPRIGLYVLGMIGLILLFTSIYKMMPVVQIRFKRALAGGITAAILWDVVRRIMVWYFSNISLINVIYGSLATVVIVLLAMEVAAIIILLGAQVIADLEAAAEAGVPWYEDLRASRDGRDRKK